MRSVRDRAARYVAVIFNRGREAAGPFAVDFLRDGESRRARSTVAGLAPQAPVTP